MHKLLPVSTRISDDLESAFFADLVPIIIKSRTMFGSQKTLDIFERAIHAAFRDIDEKGANNE